MYKKKLLTSIYFKFLADANSFEPKETAERIASTPVRTKTRQTSKSGASGRETKRTPRNLLPGVPQKVSIVETSDRYVVVDVDSKSESKEFVLTDFIHILTGRKVGHGVAVLTNKFGTMPALLEGTGRHFNQMKGGGPGRPLKKKSFNPSGRPKTTASPKNTERDVSSGLPKVVEQISLAEASTSVSNSGESASQLMLQNRNSICMRFLFS